MAFPTIVALGAFTEVAGGIADVTPGLPTGHASGDELLLFVAVASGASTGATAFSTPSGWTKVHESYNNNNYGGAYMGAACFRKTDGGSESAPTVTRTDTTGNYAGIIVAARGADPTAVASAVSYYPETAEYQLPAFTDGTLDTLAIHIGVRDTTVNIWIGAAPPRDGTWTEVGNPDGTNMSGLVGTKQLAGNVTAGVVWGEQNSSRSYMRWAISLEEAVTALAVDLDTITNSNTMHALDVGDIVDRVLTFPNGNTVTIRLHAAQGWGYDANGTPSAELPFSIVAADPPDPGSGRYLHGIMEDPAGDGALAQGFDSSASYGGFIAGLNLARDIANGTPFVVADGAAGGYRQFLCSESHATAGITTEPQVVRMGFLVGYDSDRWAGISDITDIITPPYGESHPTGDVTVSGLVAAGRGFNCSVTSGLTNYISSAQVTEWLGKMSQGWFDGFMDWNVDQFHPSAQMDGARGYSNPLQFHVNRLLWLVNTTQATNAIRAAVVRWGRQCYWSKVAGVSHGADGGTGNMRYFGIGVAGKLIGGSEGADMLALANLPAGWTTAGHTAVQFGWGEPGQTFRVSAEDIGRTLEPGMTAYGSGDIGLAEWGLRHWTYPTYDNRDWTGQPGYRRCCTAWGWFLGALACRVMGCFEDQVPSMALIAEYLDRYLATEAPLGATWMPPAQEQEIWAAFKDDIPLPQQIDLSKITNTNTMHSMVIGGGVDLDAITNANTLYPMTLIGGVMLDPIVSENQLYRMRIGTGPVLGGAFQYFYYNDYGDAVIGVLDMDYRQVVAITPSNTVGYAQADAVFSGSGGDIAVVPPVGSVFVLKNIPAGVFVRVQNVRVNSTSTTATDIAACYK